MAATDKLSSSQIEEMILFAQAAQQDLIYFSVLNTPDSLDRLNPRKSKYQWMPHHYLIAEKLQEIDSGAVRSLEIQLPPRMGKSELAVRNFVPWYAGRHPERDLLIITATYELAQEHGRDCRDYFNGSGYKLVFGDNPKAQLRSDSQSVDRLQLVGGGKIQFYGRGGIPAGVGGYGIIFDDFFKSAEEANSSTERDKAWRCYVADCLSRMNFASSWQVIIGSRKHEDDVQGRLFDETNPHFDAKTAKKFTRIRIPALSEGKETDPLGREKDEVCWPKRFPKQFYLDKRDHKSDIVRIDFQTQDQCNPRPQEGTWFKKSWFKTYRRDELPKRLTNYVASDHAYRIKDKNDKSAILKAGIDPTGAVYILPSTFWKRVETDVLADEIFNTIQTLKPAQWWAARDAISGSILPLLRRRMLDEKVFFYIDDTIHEAKDLVSRSASIRGLMAMGMVYWPQEWPQLQEAFDQLLSFPGKADDLIASLAILGMGMDRMQRPAGERASSLPPKGSFGWHSMGQDKNTTAAKGWS
ncbi:MAG: hypothetical protein KGL39_25360 [Patescibacteria group bacterium]|nr:hypothetical protein [Patescibacteria group bacterium]